MSFQLESDQEEEELELSPLPDVRSMKRGPRSRRSIKRPSCPPLLACSSDSQIPFCYTGSASAGTAAEGIEKLCQRAKLAAELQDVQLEPSLAIIFMTQQFKLEDKENVPAEVVLRHFKGCRKIQILSSQLNGAFERTPLGNFFDRNSFFAKDAAEKDGTVFLCLFQQPGLYQRACFFAGPEEQVDVIPKAQNELVAENGVTLVVCQQDGKPERMRAVTGGDLFGGNGPFPSPKTQDHRQQFTPIATLQGGTQDAVSKYGTFGLQLQGDRRIRFSLLIGTKKDKRDGVGFRRKIAELKRLVKEADETDGRGEAFLLLGFVCLVRSKIMIGADVPNDALIMEEEFPDIPVFGGFAMGEEIPSRARPNGETGMLQYHSTWVLISRLSEAEAEKRRNFRNLMVPPDFGYDSQSGDDTRE